MPAAAEDRAFQLAQQWVRIDPHYEDKTITPRERDLMLLAIRCLWSGNMVEAAIEDVQSGAITVREDNDGSDRGAG